MNDTTDSAPALPSAPWQSLPTRSRGLFVLGAVLPMAIPFAVAGFVLGRVFDISLLSGPAALLVGAALGAWYGLKQYRYTRWRLDDDGLAIQRGRLWHRETRVPITRVQHLDLKRGPLQRQRRLATLVVHTAGTRHSAVTVPNLDEDDAQRLRDRLGRQLDNADDDA